MVSIPGFRGLQPWLWWVATRDTKHLDPLRDSSQTVQVGVSFLGGSQPSGSLAFKLLSV